MNWLNYPAPTKGPETLSVWWIEISRLSFGKLWGIVVQGFYGRMNTTPTVDSDW